MKLWTPGPQFLHYFGDLFVKLGTPFRTRTRVPRGYSTAFKLLNCCQKVHQVIQSLLHIKRMACTSLFIHQAVSDGYRLAALPMSTLAATTNVENHKNEARFTFSQIHQYLQYASHFQMSDKQALRKRSKFFKSADGNLYYVGGCKLAICLLPQHIFSVLYFILHAATT